jgi:hypothetical protein
LDWKKLISLKEGNVHLTKEGLELMQGIRNGMNAKRNKTLSNI